MNPETIVGAALLGLIEGLTEFIPVSSTAHLLLAGHFMGFHNPGKTFEVLIQLGAILAIVTVYAERLIWLAASLPSPDPKGRRFVLAVVVAFLPAALIGALAHDFIKTVLFESPRLIAVVLILGGAALLALDRLALAPRFTHVMDLPLRTALGIGAFQCLALVPGVSRSGATIAGALLLGADKRTAAEFSFFLAMPTMAGAFAYDLYKNRAVIDADQVTLVAIGFVAAFVAAVLVVRTLLDFVSRHGFALFAWWRIGVGALVLALLALGVGA
jgi:undecaprenyl-diphosphatase